MTVTLDLPKKLEHKLSECADRQGVSAEWWLREVVTRELQGTPTAEESPAEEKPFWEEIEERMRQLPDDAFDGLPTDGAAEHDHYLYGSPKKYS